MAAGSDRLKEIAEIINSGKTPDPVTVRTFLSWFYAQRRGFYIVREIRNELRKASLKTVPDFEYEYIDGLIRFVQVEQEPATATVTAAGSVACTGTVVATVVPASPNGSVSASTQEATGLPTGNISQSPTTPTIMADPTYRIGKLAAANRVPTSVKPDATIAEATTLMLINNFSQLPVMQSEITVKGVVSWSSIGSRLALALPVAKVSDCMDRAIEKSSEDSLFAIIADIVQYQYVLIRGNDNKIKGIVTTSDLSLQFGQLAEPFLLIGEIEQHIRMLIEGRFSLDELKAARDPEDDDRDITGVPDLTFGEYIRLLENPDRWSKTSLRIDRSIFIEQLQAVRKIRNDVMHFDPDGITEEERDRLRQAVQFLQTLQQLGAFAHDKNHCQTVH